jgi:hypothetical protein
LRGVCSIPQHGQRNAPTPSWELAQGTTADIPATTGRPNGCVGRPTARGIHPALKRWLDGLVSAPEAPIEVGGSGDLAGLKIVEGHVAEARTGGRRSGCEHARLTSETQPAVRAAGRG